MVLIFLLSISRTYENEPDVSNIFYLISFMKSESYFFLFISEISAYVYNFYHLPNHIKVFKFLAFGQDK